MKPYLLVLIAAVTVNCLVTAINGETSSEALTVPYIDMLLPPFEDKADSGGEAAAVGKAEINVKAKVTPVLKTTKSKTNAKTATTTTKKSIINDVNNNLAAPSLEALLPPLFEAITEKAVTTTTKKTTTTRPITTTRRPTTKRTTTTTTTRRPITTTTTTLKPTKATKVQVPDLLLDPLLPPLVDNEIVAKDEVTATTTTQKPLAKTTKKSYYQQQQQQQLKHLPVDNKKDHKNFQALKSGLKTNDKHVAETKIQIKQVISIPSNIESVTSQHVAKQTTASQEKRTNYNSKQQNYNYDLYFGSTTPRPVKNGLPTITPFPHRLGR
ncbi:hypothetical protein DOY81_000929 [Sarcophaga bullata]|nr:hypothetical protein DOY81_000929 [Sarcophaga bullata]